MQTTARKQAQKTNAFLRFCRQRLLPLLPNFSLALSLCLSEPIDILLMAVGGVLFHELGHLLAFSATTRALPSLSLDRFGLRLVPRAPLLPQEELWICLGGPLTNILLGLLFCRFFGDFGFTFGAMHFLFALFNLLPFESSDGGRVLRLLFLRRFDAKKAKAYTAFCSAAVLAFLFILGLYTFYLTGNGLCVAFFAVFSFPWRTLESQNDLRDFKRKKEISREKQRF